jgi:hypothetical protein
MIPAKSEQPRSWNHCLMAQHLDLPFTYETFFNNTYYNCTLDVCHCQEACNPESHVADKYSCIKYNDRGCLDLFDLDAYVGELKPELQPPTSGASNVLWKHNRLSRCEDCDTVSQVETVGACSDAHITNSTCCTKKVCKGYCSYMCMHCGVLNALYREDMFEDYFEEFTCYRCNVASPAQCKYWGDLAKACTRHCGGECFKRGFRVSGRCIHGSA